MLAGNYSDLIKINSKNTHTKQSEETQTTMLRTSIFISLACLAALTPAITLSTPPHLHQQLQSIADENQFAELAQSASYFEEFGGMDSRMSQVGGDAEFLGGLAGDLKKMGGKKMAMLKK